MFEKMGNSIKFINAKVIEREQTNNIKIEFQLNLAKRISSKIKTH